MADPMKPRWSRVIAGALSTFVILAVLSLADHVNHFLLAAAANALVALIYEVAVTADPPPTHPEEREP